MATTHRLATTPRLATLGVAFLGLATFAGRSASAVLIDNFNSGSLAAYTQTTILDNNTTRQISFTAADGTVRSAYDGTAGAAAEQTVLLRGDFSVAVGQNLLGDVIGFNAATGFDRDVGIAIGTTATPAPVPAGSATDVRSNFAEVSLRSNNQAVSFARDGTTNLASGQLFTGTGPSPTQTFNNTDPITLYIARTSATTYDVGFIQNNFRRLVASYTFTGANTPGAAVGLYTDLRAAISPTPIGIDNLRVEAIPEPTTLAAVVALGGVTLRRRRQA